MGKTKTAVPATERRQSARLATLKPARAAVEAKKKPAAKVLEGKLSVAYFKVKKGTIEDVLKPPKTKKAKVSENGSAKAEEPKAEATEAK